MLYQLDLDTGVARIVWQFSFPLAVGAAAWTDVLAADVYNACGGSAYRLPGGTYLVAFTAMAGDDQGYSNETRTRTALAWEIDADGADDAGGDGDDGDGDGGADDDDAAFDSSSSSSRGSSGAATRTSGPRVRASLRIPIPHDYVGDQNGYRLLPWHSIAGGGGASPF